MAAIPKNEKRCTEYLDAEQVLRFVCTTVGDYESFVLYEVKGSDFKKLGTAKSPLDLEERYSVMDKLRPPKRR